MKEGALKEGAEGSSVGSGESSSEGSSEGSNESCHALMTFSILVSRYRSDFFLRNIVLLVPCCWLCS